MSWDDQSLEEVLNRRIHVYSSGNISNYHELFASECTEDFKEILSMSNENPRDLWHLLNNCIEEQYKINNSIFKISKEAIVIAIRKFVTDFNYYEYYPRKNNARKDSMDIYSYIKHLQKLDDIEFTKDKLNVMAGTGGSTNNYVVAMENMGLIRRSSKKAQGGSVIYSVKDPKVIYAMKNSIEIERP